MKLSMAERFWRNVDRRGDDDCWPWTRSCQSSGHGTFNRGKVNGKQKNERAHRVAWELTNGPIPDGLKVCHSCDNPPCCNPRHLFLGTQAVNVADMRAKGRGTQPVFRGESHPRAVLTDAQVEEIRMRREHGALLRELAAIYGVGTSQIRRICVREQRIAS